MTEKTIIRLPVVRKRTGNKSKSSIYADISAGTFPAPIKIGSRAVGWIESEIDEWIEDRINACRSQSFARNE